MSNTTTNTNASQPKRRKYSTRACVFCRNRHKKCDGGQPCLACDQRKQDCVYPEQQKKRGPKPRSSLNVGNTTTSGLMVAPTHSGSVSNSVLSAVDFGTNPMVGISNSGNPAQGKTKKRRLSMSEERLPAVTSEIMGRDGGLTVEQIGLCQCLQEIIQSIQQHPRAAPFLQPVSLSVAPDYYDVIPQPIDFGTMLQKVNSFQYISLEEFSSDLELLVDNCRRYNVGTQSAYLIEWALELKNTVLDQLQKRPDTCAFLWYPQPISPSVEQFENYRTNNELDIAEFYEIDVRCPQLYTPPLENLSIFDYDFPDNSLSPYSEFIEFHNPSVYGEQKFL